MGRRGSTSSKARACKRSPLFTCISTTLSTGVLAASEKGVSGTLYIWTCAFEYEGEHVRSAVHDIAANEQYIE